MRSIVIEILIAAAAGIAVSAAGFIMRQEVGPRGRLVTDWLIRKATAKLPESVRDRWWEEMRADLAALPGGPISRFLYALRAAATRQRLLESVAADLVPVDQDMEELKSVRDRLEFVVHAGSRLASTLDVGITLETVADLVVPQFGRLCVVDLWNGRRLESVYVREDERCRTSLVPEMLDLSGTQREDHPAIQAVRTGRPVIVPSTDESVLAKMYDDPKARQIVIEATGGTGFVTLPLITRGRVIGVLTLQGPGHPGRSLTVDEDVQMLEQVATRAAQSIENAQLFAAERRLARRLAPT